MHRCVGLACDRSADASCVSLSGKRKQATHQQTHIYRPHTEGCIRQGPTSEQRQFAVIGHYATTTDEAGDFGRGYLLPSCPVKRNLIYAFMRKPTTTTASTRPDPSSCPYLFPRPRMRENILHGIVAGLLDEDELCADLVSVDNGRLGEKSSLIIWGSS